ASFVSQCRTSLSECAVTGPMFGGAFMSCSRAVTWIDGTGYVVSPLDGVNGSASTIAECTHLDLTRGRSKRRLIPTLRQIQVNRRIKRTLFNRSAGSGVCLEGTSPQLPQTSMTGTSQRLATGSTRRSHPG